ncbi:MAG: fasciclin domain-containing protein [Niabella sp.]
MKRYCFLIVCSTVILMGACKKWEDHISLPEQQLSETLLEYMQKDPQLSSFIAYSQQTGLDSLLGASKNITVFAPTNDALATLPNLVKSDMTQLKAYLQNHISANAYFTRDAADSFRVPVLNGKNIFFVNKKFDEANITEGDIYVSNGVLHKIDKVIAPMQSIWEYIEATKNDYQQNAYIASLNFIGQDPNLAEVDSINPNTGEPVYKPGTGIVTINTFKTKVSDVANEDSLYTYILLTNDAFNTEKTRLLPYFKARNADTANNNASWAVVKDLAIKGLYNEATLPAVLLSRFGVQIPMNRSAIVSVKKLSNGIAYILNAANTALSEKIPAVYVEGENPYSFNVSSSAPIFYRQRTNPLTGLPFNDIYLNLGSGGANRYVGYFTNQLFTARYKVYLMSLNDKVVSGVADGTYGTDSSLNHTVWVYDRNADTISIKFNESVDVTANTYTEFYMGEFTNEEYNWLLSYPPNTPDGVSYIINPATQYIRVIAPATATGRPYNLTLNYLRFEPVF